MLRTPVEIMRCEGDRLIYRFLQKIDRCPVSVCTVGEWSRAETQVSVLQSKRSLILSRILLTHCNILAILFSNVFHEEIV